MSFDIRKTLIHLRETKAESVQARFLEPREPSSCILGKQRRNLLESRALLEVVRNVERASFVEPVLRGEARRQGVNYKQSDHTAVARRARSYSPR